MNKAIVGWGNGLTGPTTPCHEVVCAGPKWITIPISKGMETLAIVIMQENENMEDFMARAHKIADALNNYPQNVK